MNIIFGSERMGTCFTSAPHLNEVTLLTVKWTTTFVILQKILTYFRANKLHHVANVANDWMELRQRMMTLLQEEAELEEIVKMVGMDALSPGDRLKMEAARSIREDFLHQNSFHEIDTYTSLEKQHNMMRLVLAFYDAGLDALKQGADINDIVKLPVREQIGRYKYTKEDQLAAEYEKVTRQLAAETAELLGKEGL